LVNKRFSGGEAERFRILCWRRREGRERLKREKGALWMNKGEGKLTRKRKRRKMSACVLILRREKKRRGDGTKMTAEGGMRLSGGRKRNNGGLRICGTLRSVGGRNEIGLKKKKRRRERGLRTFWNFLAWLGFYRILSQRLLAQVGTVMVLLVLLPQPAGIRP
jgi:hypothetical protein